MLQGVNAARLDRALSVLGNLAQHHEGRSLSDLAKDLGLPMSSTHDLMQALVEIGAVRLAGPRVYALGPRAVSLGLLIADSVQLRRVARPHLTDLAREVEENVYLAVRTGDDIAYADRYEASQLLSVVLRLGGNRPLHASAVGKLLAAFNPDLESKALTSPRLEPFTPFTLTDRDALRAEYAAVRERGYSVTSSEAVEGITGLATPIADADGVIAAAIHICAPRGRLDDRVPMVVAAMSATGATISALLGAPEGSVTHAGIDDIVKHERTRRGD
jgi:DNA-binding IclR family transcriptional regulator